MATALQNLEARRNTICQELADLDGTKQGGKANASGSASVDHVGYKDGLYRELAQINEQIAALGGPAEVVTYGRL